MRSTSLSDGSCYFGTARVTARQRVGIEDASPATLPSASFLSCGARALLGIAAPLPFADELLVGLFGMTGELDLAITQLFDVVRVSRASLISFPNRLAGLQLHGPQLVRDQGRASPLVIGLLGQQVPAQHGQLARHSNGRDLMTAAGSDAQKKGAQGTWRFGCGPRRLDQHGASVGAPSLADATMLSKSEPGLPYPRVQTDVADQALGVGETVHIADRRRQAGSDDQVDAGDREQPLDCRVLDRRLGDLFVEDTQILAQPIELAQVPFDGGTLVIGNDL